MMSIGRIILVFCICAGTAFLSSLGVWQLQRLDWKVAMIERVERGLQAEPVSVDEIAEDLSAGLDIEYRPATASGTFIHEAEAHYFATYEGRPGYFVYTPLRRANGMLLFVNRGFVPIDLKNAATRKDGQITGFVSINGLARSNPLAKPNTFVPENDPLKNIYYWKNIAEMSAQGMDQIDGTVMPFFLDADATLLDGAGAPVGGVTRVTFNNPHLQYAITWFGLAAALLFVGGWFFFSGRRRSVTPKP